MKIIVYVVFVIFTLGFTEQGDADIKQKVNSIRNTDKCNIKSSKMKIKKELLNGTDYNEILYALVENCYPEYDDENFDQLDEVTQTFVLIVNMDGQVMNGGIVQFIDNGTGNYFHETVDALNRIKSNGLVKVLNKAAEQFPNSQVPTNWDLRRQIWDEIGDKHVTPGSEYDIVDEEWEELWEDLDRSYYENSNVMYKDLIEYLKINALLIN
jgi:hypothetical protein